MNFRWFLKGGFLLLLALAMPQVLWSQQAQKEDTQESKEDLREALNQLLEEAAAEMEKKNWSAALDKYKKAQEHLNNHPDIFFDAKRQLYEERKQHIIFSIGVCYYNLAAARIGNFEQNYNDAVDHFKRITELVVDKDKQHYHGEAYYYLARTAILKGHSDEVIATVQEYLKKAKQHGFNVFVGIKEDPNLQFLAQEPKFFLEILNTPTLLTQKDLESVEDPFRLKVEVIRKVKEEDEFDTGPVEQTVFNPKYQQELIQEIQSTFKKLKQALKKSDRDTQPKKEVILLWKKFQDLMKRQDEIMLPSYKEILKEVQREYSLLESQLENVQLAYYYNQGKELLDRIREYFTKKQYTQVLRYWRKLVSLCQEMSRYPNEDFKRTANSLLLNGQNFQKQARIYLRLRTIPHKVTGIIIQEFPQNLRVAIVNNHAYVEGEEVMSEDGEPLGLRIRKIEPGKVVFVYQGVEVESLLREE